MVNSAFVDQLKEAVADRPGYGSKRTFNECRVKQFIVLRIGIGLASLCINAYAQGPEPTLFDHAVRLDANGKLLSWIPGDAPYSTLIRREWAAFERIPVQPNGYRTYFTNPTFNGSTTPEHKQFSGREWYHNPAGLFTMITDGALLYHAYSGDQIIVERVREMLDHQLRFGLTKQSDTWSLVPYASSDCGDPVYRGAPDGRFEVDGKGLGRGDGIGFLEPDKVGEMGAAYVSFYEATSDRTYLNAAIRCANALAQNIQPGDMSHSPWPFRVDAKTGKVVREAYTANAIGPIKLFDELIRIGEGSLPVYRRARSAAWNWLMAYPMRNGVWTQYFEDVLIYNDYRENINQYIPMETARYLIQHPEFDPNWKAHAKGLIDWVASHFAKDSTTMGGLPEKGNQWGAEVLSEQVNDMDKISSHTSRFASVLALWYEKTGDASARERAFRSFNWATYSARESGLTKTSLDEGTGYWFSDGYGDYMRHFQRGMASVPDWDPMNEDHLLGSTSIVRMVDYRPTVIRYATFDRSAREVLRLRQKPKAVVSGSRVLPILPSLGRLPGYTVDRLANGGFVVRIYHASSNAVTILN